jgi:hypothetical protein
MTASSTTLGCHGNYGNPRTHGVARQQHLKACISDRPSPAETVETAPQSLELDFATRLEQETLPLPTQLCGHTWHWHPRRRGLQWREIAEMNGDLTTESRACIDDAPQFFLALPTYSTHRC